MHHWTLAAALAAACVLACDPDGPVPGVRSECAATGGFPLSCEHGPLEDPEEACWKLVECGSIPVANPEGQEGCCFDWSRCVRYLERLETHRYDVSMSCLSQASCDQLRFPGGPNAPGREPHQLPPCLEYGDQP